MKIVCKLYLSVIIHRKDLGGRKFLFSLFFQETFTPLTILIFSFFTKTVHSSVKTEFLSNENDLCIISLNLSVVFFIFHTQQKDIFQTVFAIIRGKGR